jgi:hypothetical protein
MKQEPNHIAAVSRSCSGRAPLTLAEEAEEKVEFDAAVF